MTVTASLISFLIAISLLTVTPGLDTALVLRTAATEGPGNALRAALGINVGCLMWGAAVAFGAGELLAASELAYTALKWAGAAYLCWLGAQMLLRPRTGFELDAKPGGKDGARRNAAQNRMPGAAGVPGGRTRWFLRGLLSNLLNPKVGVFYISFLPQFVPAGEPVVPYTFGLSAIHVAVGVVWCGSLILATRPLGHLLRLPRVVKALDRITGAVFIGFGIKLALSRR
ncbi:LysE family translocator [Robbsia sp. Bb-Pol-6]|uniref:LysE family translocator n=1 Tax=Robbsia betulipollinis TaxID=2981849 RepID=A0ABT3ZR57_9BURK|nr:LysE family translocator [Robbsia betulipollinis]MCY0389033.1 LysE family translocator [Robbsia betulipollinis]